MRGIVKYIVIFLILMSLLSIDSASLWAGDSTHLGNRTASAQGIELKEEQSLLVRDTKVVENPSRTFNPCSGVGTPMGKWTFGHLIKEMANEPVTGLDPSKIALGWLREWGVNKTVNGDIIGRRPEQPLLIPWEEAGGGRNQPLDLSMAPFKLLAIVNRIDLWDDLDQGGHGAGELRFVFGAVDLENNCAPLDFTVIFEYQVPRETCQERVTWAQMWARLSMLELGSQRYNAVLEALTERVVKAGANPNMLPNQSSLNSLLSNESFLGQARELRAFKLGDDIGRGTLVSVPVKQSPNDQLNRSATLVDYINQNEASILARNYTIPETFNGSPFQGGANLVFPSTHWNGPRNGPLVNNNEARHIFSLNTCSGCHARETGIQGFAHIKPAPFGTVADLSGFMTGIDVVDPVDRVTVRHFDELERRTLELEDIRKTSCGP
jgi:hypothetical protein